MAQAEASGSVSASGGGDGGGVAREAQGSGGGDDWVTAAEEVGTAYATAAMSKEEIARAIETSRERGLWSEVPQRGLGAAALGDGGAGADAVLWEQLKCSDPAIFVDTPGGEVELGRLIAEGGQAKIYQVMPRQWLGDGDCVAKVFKMEGFSLEDLERQWPRTRATVHTLDANHDNSVALDRIVFGVSPAFCTYIYLATFLKDGRFAFVMPRYWGDLRTLIDLKLKDNNSQGPPFSPSQAPKIMWYIAMGIKRLHDVGVLHRDLKAANVLVRTHLGGDPRYDDKCTYEVADYESAMMVVGTGFWRAPEVLKELMKQPCDRKDEIWTEKVDVYSYAMTCYEVLTGHLPFYGYGKKDWKRIIDGERPHLSDYIDSRVKNLVERCWHKDPSRRPLFETIVDELNTFIWI